MTITDKFFGADQQPFQLRYVESVGEWEVLDSTGVVYIGTKQNCKTFIQACSWFKNIGKS